MSGFTPGPWRVEQDYYVMTDDHSIADLDISGAEDHEVRANARLIAAAPELLRALKNAFIAIDESKWVGLRAEIRAAVAKAEGRNET